MKQTHIPDHDNGNEAQRKVLVNRLYEVVTPLDVGAVIVSLARALPDCTGAALLGDDCQILADDFSAQDVEWALATLRSDERPQLDDSGQLAAVSLLPTENIVLLLRFSVVQTASSTSKLADSWVAQSRRQLRRALELADLQDSHRQLERSEQLQRALFAISDLAGSDLDMPDMLRGIHEIVGTLMYGKNFFIVKHDPDHSTLRFLYYADTLDQEGQDTTRETPLEDWRGTLTHYLLTSGRPLMGSADELRAQIVGPLLTVGPDSVDWLGVPMILDGQVLGALVVQSYQAGMGFTEEDRELLSFVGNHILTALERKQSKDELESRVRLRTQELAEANRVLQQQVVERERAEQLQAALFQLAQLATADIDENEFYTRVHAVVDALLNAHNFFIALLSADRQRLEFPYYIDNGPRHVAPRPLAHGFSEYVLRTGEPLLAGLAEIEELTRRGEVVRRVFGQPAISWLGVPLQADDEVIGLVTVQSTSHDVSYSIADRELLSFAALQIANSIHRRRSAASLHQATIELEQRVQERTRELRQEIHQREQVQEQLKHQVMHDPLTGLPNRDFLRLRLDRMLSMLQHKTDSRCALLYLDIDRFKVVNDSLGHLAGDEFLKAVANRLHFCVRDPDMVARLSGDEFAILLENLISPEYAVKVAERILRTLGEPLKFSGKDLQPSASIGIAIGDSRYTTSDALLRDADIALYRAKDRGRNRFEMFDETLVRDLVDVLSLETELRHALSHDEFVPYFQPICSLHDREVVGYEALIRWNHPQRGTLAPSDFLRIAEDSGLIEAIDWRMFENSCRLFGDFAAADAFLTINVSARHLRHPDFDTRLLQLLQRVHLAPKRVVVEVTEGALLDNPAHVRATLARLRESGVGAALDDFGTGYSSLSYLHSLPLRMLKIDQAFVHDLKKPGGADSTPVVMAILALARALGIQVIAEGVETQSQCDTLHKMGCEMAQGYLLGYPSPAENWLQQVADAG